MRLIPCEIICEVGVNHDGSLSKALDLVEAAKDCGADVVKFQCYKPSEFMRPSDPDWDLLTKLALPFVAFRQIAAHCDAVGIEFMATPDGIESLKFLVEECHVRRIKIGSAQLTNRALLGTAYNMDLPVILSTGMATLEEVADALPAPGTCDLTLLHCVSLYPCPIELANLRAMETIRTEFGLEFRIGLSDHTMSTTVVPAMAVALGAVMIEKHLTLDHCASGPDHAASMEPDQFRHLVAVVREAERALGDGIKAPGPAELEAARRLRVGAGGVRGQ